MWKRNGVRAENWEREQDQGWELGKEMGSGLERGGEGTGFRAGKGMGLGLGKERDYGWEREWGYGSGQVGKGNGIRVQDRAGWCQRNSMEKLQHPKSLSWE